MLLLRVYSIFVMVMLLIGIANIEVEDKVDAVAAGVVFIIFTPVLITLIYGGAC